jgi:hypothetical protein
LSTPTPQLTPTIHLLHQYSASDIPTWFFFMWVILCLLVCLVAYVSKVKNERQREQEMIRRDEQETAEQEMLYKRWEEN